jgi:hypothetical protein
MKRFIIAACALLLMGAMLVQWLWSNRTLPGKGMHLQGALPQEIGGWTGHAALLGTTEAAEGAVEKILNFDDVYFREFRSGKGVLSLYIAYWNPGKIPTQLVASHTPDRCWSSAGWECREMRHNVSLPGLKPGAWRDFAAPGSGRLDVIFWHVIGDGLYDYGERFTRVPHPMKWWRDVVKQIVTPPKEQYFIRLTSDRPFEEIQDDAGFQEVLAALAKLGLAAGAGAAPPR